MASIVEDMSFNAPGRDRIDSEVARAREADAELAAGRHAIEHPDPPADDPRTRGVLARVRRLLRRRGQRSAQT